MKLATRNLEEQPVEETSWFSLVRQGAASIQFGVIEIKVHDGEVVQIEITRKLRFDEKPLQPQFTANRTIGAKPTNA